MNKPKLALLLTGIHYKEYYNHFRNGKINIDFRFYINNIKSKLIDHLAQLYNIDIFICSNKSIITDELVAKYNPVSYSFIDDNRNTKILNVYNLLNDYIINKKVNYNIIAFTRFDICFMKDFTNIDYNKLNLVSILENNNLTDDNFHLYPIKYYYSFYNIINKELPMNINNVLIFHSLLDKFRERFEINYLCNENTCVPNLSFFKLHYFNIYKVFNISQYKFINNLPYYSINNDAKLVVNDTKINFSKLKKNICSYAWFNYNIDEKGDYNITFEILSDKNINFNFIKFKDNTISSIFHIKENELTKVSFDTQSKINNNKMIIIFNKYEDLINITITNLKITKLTRSTIPIINNIKINNKMVKYIR